MIRKRQTLFKFLIIILLFISNANYSKPKNTEEQPRHILSYALPHTSLQITINTTKTKTHTGIFKEYAKKYFDLQNVIQQDETTWTISSIEITTHTKPSKKQYQLILNGNGNNPSVHLSEDGILLGINLEPTIHNLQTTTYKPQLENYNPTTKTKDITHGHITHNEIYQIKEENTFLTKETDTGTTIVPVIKKQIIPKNIDLKALEASEFIYEVRQRKLDLLSAEYETVLPNGDAYQVAVEQLNLIEQQHLELFTGTTTTTTQQYHYTITPNTSQKTTLCYFSKQAGISKSKDPKNTPIDIHFTLEKSNHQTIASTSVQNLSQQKLYYQKPARTTIEIIRGKHILHTEQILMPQFGELISLPIQNLTPNTQIEYHPNTGALKKIRY